MTGKRRRAKAAEETQLSAAEGVAVPAAPTREGTAASDVSGAIVTGSVVEGTTADGNTVSTFVPDDAVVRRTKDGWRVGSEDLPDLTCAMILSDLLAAASRRPESAPPQPGAPPHAGDA